MQTIKTTTQDHLDVEDIINNLVFLKDKTAAMVLSISAVNFNLLSEEEQDAIIYAYAALLNSLSFPIQILIRSQRKDITHYLKLLESQEKRQLDPTIKQRISQYRQFIAQIVKERNVLDKKFFIIIPFSYADLGISPSTFPLPGKKAMPSIDKNYLMQKVVSTLEPRRDHLLRQLGNLGLAAKQLNTQQLIQLLYTIYNPDAADGIQTISTKQYASPLVQANTL